MSSTTLWTKGSVDESLYSDWKVSFITIDDLKKDAGSVSTASLSEEEDIEQSSPDAREEQEEVEGQSQDDHEDQREELFSVHRNMIGPKSNYFTQSFLGKIESGKANSSVILLPSDIPSHTFASVLEAFELLLDYCYNGKESLVADSKLVTDNGVAMFCLCKYFQMDSDICNKVLDFIKADLTHDTIAKYYQIIKDMRSTVEIPLVLDTKTIMEIVVSMCHENPSVLDSQTDLFKIADLTLWLSIGSLLANDDANEDANEEDAESASADASRVWSSNLTSFFNTYDEEGVLEIKDSFRTLTAEKVLPEVSSMVALRLLELERKYGLESLTRQVKKAKELDGESLSQATSNISEDGTVSTTEDSDMDVVLDEELTSLQKRCVKALCESNWSGEENDVEQMRGKLVDITTPAVLEALLIDSVTGKRAMAASVEEMKAGLNGEKKALAQEIELFEFKQGESKYEVAMEKQKQLKLQHKLDAARNEFEAAQRKLKKAEAKAVKDKAELCKANARLEAELEEEKKKSHALNQKYRALETAEFKLNSDRENYEMTIKETIKQLDAITSYDEPYGACGLGHLILLLSSISDRHECRQIKKMLQQVVKDPQTYERDYLLKDKTVEDDNATTASFLTTDDLSRA